MSWCCETLAKYPGFIPHVTWGPLLIGEKHTSTRETWDKKFCNQLIGSNLGINCKGNVKLIFFLELIIIACDCFKLINVIIAFISQILKTTEIQKRSQFGMNMKDVTKKSILKVPVSIKARFKRHFVSYALMVSKALVLYIKNYCDPVFCRSTRFKCIGWTS